MNILIKSCLKSVFSPFKGVGELSFHKGLWGLFLALALFSSCDSGDIAEKKYSVETSGKTIVLTGRIVGASSLDGTGYLVALSGFTTDSKYAVVQRSIPLTTKDSTNIELEISNISNQVSTVEVTLTNRLRERILPLTTLNMSEMSGNTDTIRLGTVNISLFGCIQKGIFDKACIQCHGEPGHCAAGMSLTEGNAYASLVGVTSTLKEGETRVIPSDAKNSLLHKLLNTGGENLLHYNHTEVLSSQFKDNLSEVKALLDNWINKGAKK